MTDNPTPNDIALLREALKDPNAVHANMLRGEIAKPSVAQMIHVYGEETIRAAFAPGQHPADVTAYTPKPSIEQARP